MKKIYKMIPFLGTIFFSSTTISASDFREDTIIEFGGKRKPAAAFIKEAKLNPVTHPFSLTEVVEYNSPNFVSKGTIVEISDKDMEHINTGNFVYIPNFRVGEILLGDKKPLKIPAFIINTKDKTLIRDLLKAYLEFLLKKEPENKKSFNLQKSKL